MSGFVVFLSVAKLRSTYGLNKVLFFNFLFCLFAFGNFLLHLSYYYPTRVSLIIISLTYLLFLLLRYVSVFFCSPWSLLFALWLRVCVPVCVSKSMKEPAAAVGALAPVLVSSWQWWLMSSLTWTHHAPLHPPHPLNTHTHAHSGPSLSIVCSFCIWQLIWRCQEGSSKFATRFLFWSCCFLSVLCFTLILHIFLLRSPWVFSLHTEYDYKHLVLFLFDTFMMKINYFTIVVLNLNGFLTFFIFIFISVLFLCSTSTYFS